MGRVESGRKSGGACQHHLQGFRSQLLRRGQDPSRLRSRDQPNNQRRKGRQEPFLEVAETGNQTRS